MFTENCRALFSWSSVVCSFLQNCEDRVTHLFYFQLIQSIQANYGHGTNEHPNLDLLNRFQVCDACLVLTGPSYLCFMLQFFWQDRTKTWLVWAVKTYANLGFPRKLLLFQRHLYTTWWGQKSCPIYKGSINHFI